MIEENISHFINLDKYSIHDPKSKKYQSVIKEAKERYGNKAGEITVCKLIEEDSGVNLQVEGDWIAPWEVKHPDEK